MTASNLPPDEVSKTAQKQKTDDFSDLCGFFKNGTEKLTTEELCQPVKLSD